MILAFTHLSKYERTYRRMTCHGVCTAGVIPPFAGPVVRKHRQVTDHMFEGSTRATAAQDGTVFLLHLAVVVRR